MERIEAIAPSNLRFQSNWLGFGIGELFQVSIPVLEDPSVNADQLAGPRICLRTSIPFANGNADAALIVSGQFAGRFVQDYQMRDTGGIAVGRFVRILLRTPAIQPAGHPPDVGNVCSFQGALWMCAQDLQIQHPARAWIRIDGGPGERGVSRRDLGAAGRTFVAQSTTLIEIADATIPEEPQPQA